MALRDLVLAPHFSGGNPRLSAGVGPVPGHTALRFRPGASPGWVPWGRPHCASPAGNRWPQQPGPRERPNEFGYVTGWSWKLSQARCWGKQPTGWALGGDLAVCRGKWLSGAGRRSPGPGGAALCLPNRCLQFWGSNGHESGQWDQWAPGSGMCKTPTCGLALAFAALGGQAGQERVHPCPRATWEQDGGRGLGCYRSAGCYAHEKAESFLGSVHPLGTSACRVDASAVRRR